MTLITPTNPILYTDIPLLNQCRNIPHPQIHNILEGIKKAIINGECICPIYIDVLCGQSNFVTYTFSQLEADLKNTVLIYKIHCYGRFNYSEKSFLYEFLDQLGHSLHNIGTQYTCLERLVKYFTHLCVLYRKETIVVIINESQNLKKNDYKVLTTLTSNLKVEGIQLLFLLVGDTFTLQDTFTRIPFKDYGILIKTIFQVGTISTEQDMSYVLEQYDYICTSTFFPYAYTDGLRLIKDVNSILDAFKIVSSTASILSVISIPLDILIQTVEICFKLYGALGEKKYWPSKQHWIQSISYTCYLSYIHKI